MTSILTVVVAERSQAHGTARRAVARRYRTQPGPRSHARRRRFMSLPTILRASGSSARVLNGAFRRERQQAMQWHALPRRDLNDTVGTILA